MTKDANTHERVEFRRGEIVDLRALPSASGQLEMCHTNRPVHRVGRFLFRIATGLVVFVAVLWIAVALVGSSGPVSRLLQARVEAVVRQAMGPDVSLTMGPAGLKLDGARALAVHVSDFGLRQPDTGRSVDAADLSVGVRLLPLLAGRLELSDAAVSGARIELGQSSANPAWLEAVSRDDGLIDPDRIAPVAFGFVKQLSDVLRRGGESNFTLEDVTLVTGGREIVLEQMALSNTGADLAIGGTVLVEGVSYAVEGAAASGPDHATAFNLTGRSAADPAVAADTEASLAGVWPQDAANPVVRIALRRSGHQIDLGPRGIIDADVDLVARAAQGEGKVEIERLNLRASQSLFRYTGAFGPAPAQGGAPAYRFELVSNDSVIEPEGSTETPLQAGIQLLGLYDPASRRIDLNDIRVRASSGEASGNATLVLADGKSPALRLDVNVANMDVGQVKQLWPWVAAGGARRWVMNNFFGGQVVAGRVRYNIGPGRLQNRDPLSPEEVSGEFAISGSRFDTAGVLPAVREAEGSVSFAGERVEVRLASGKSFVGDGRQISLSNGLMTIADARVRPLIARMDMDFAGDAVSVAEVASMEPLNALRGLDFAPSDLSGAVTGHVSADIPLQKGIDPKTLDWSADLKYNNLAIAKPIQGQRVTQADGTLRLQPDRAVIDAKGRLNNIPAEFEIVQPLRGSAVPVRRDIALVLGDKERAAVAPALNTLISGPVKVKLDASARDARKIEADLTQARLSIPWAGWSKGAGIAATASLELMNNGQVRNLNIKGASFAARGSLDMSGGTLRSARFDKLALNQGDDVAMSVTRDGAAYKVDLSGASLDGRAIIKQLYDQGGGETSRNAVVVTANIESLGGFNDQTMRNVKVNYRTGGGAASTSLSGIVGRNAPFSMDDERSQGQRRISVSSGDAGSLLRFLNVYTRMEGGTLQISAAGSDTLRGKAELRNFDLVNESRLSSVVSTRPAGSNKSLNDSTASRINTQRVQFDRGYAELAKGPQSLRVANAVLRGPVIGTTFEGTVYDANNHMELNGTFLPAYGLNSIFGDIPMLGAFLGGGPNGGLIGVTYRLRGSFRSPTVEVNPLSAIAPGIFRKIFEY